jgi:hypothetical protein
MLALARTPQDEMRMGGLQVIHIDKALLCNLVVANPLVPR